MAADEGVGLTDFPTATGFSDSDLISITQNGATVKPSVSQLKDAVAVNRAVEQFIPGDGVTSGTFLPGGTSLTLTGSYGSINNIDVFADGAPQVDCSLSGHILGFPNGGIPAGISVLTVKAIAARQIGTSSDGTVTDVKAAALSALSNPIFDPINPRDPTYGAAGNTVLNSAGAFVSGQDDTAAIQAAAAAASSRGGGRIELTGTFCVSGAITLGDNVELVGKSGRIFYKKPAFNYEHCIILQGKNNTVRDLHISCDPALVRADTGFGLCVNGATDALVENCSFSDIASAAIWVTNARNTRILGNRISNAKADGIHFSDGAIGFVAEGNILNGTQDDAIAVVLDTVGAAQPLYGVVAGNTVNGTARGHGVVFIGCVGLTIDSNTLVNIGASSGIGNYQWNADTRKAINVSITGNLISQVGLTVGSFAPSNAMSVHGILLGFCADVTVTGNTITDIADNAGYTSSGIFLYAYNRVVIKANTIKNCVSHGIWVYDATPSAAANLADLYIDDNSFINVGRYAIKANPASAFLNGLFVTGNKFKDCAYTSTANVVSLGRTQATPLRYYGNVLLNFEVKAPLLDATNASDIKQANNIPAI